MSNLVKFAEAELKSAGMGPYDKTIDDIDRLMGKCVIDVVKTFSKQGHSGSSAPYCIGLIEKLLMFEPIRPLTGKDDEWNDVSEEMGYKIYQNKRCGHVFKEVKPNGESYAYDSEGRVFRDKGGGSYTSKKSRVKITFPYVPKIKYVNRRWWKFWL